MNHKAKRILTLIMLAAMLLSLPEIGASAADTDLTFDEYGNVTNSTKLSFTVGPNSDVNDFFADISKAKVQVDLYKVAEAVQETVKPGESRHGSMYVFKPLTAFAANLTGIDTYAGLKEKTNDSWRSMAQSAANTLFGGVLPQADYSFDATTSGIVGPLDVAAGLYLVIAHGSDLDQEDYVVMDGENVTTIAETTLYQYTYYPELIALPTTVSEMGQIAEGTLPVSGDPYATYSTYTDTDGTTQKPGVSTAGGTWQTDLKAMLKPVREYRYGDLYITKQVLNWDKRSPVTFVFEISASWTEKGVQKNYHNFVTLSFTSATKEYYAILQKFPVGTEVTVKEVYSGMSYSITGTEQTQIIEIPAPIKTTEENPGGDMTAAGVAEYVNTYNHGESTGYGIENEFTSDGDDWVIRKIETPWKGDSVA